MADIKESRIERLGCLTDIRMHGLSCRGRNGSFKGKLMTLWQPEPGRIRLEVTSRQQGELPPIAIGLSREDAGALILVLQEQLACSETTSAKKE